jgi:putative aldouronate transport system substrate-binding protein
MKKIIFLSAMAILILAVSFQAAASAVSEGVAAEEPMTISWFGPFGGEIQDGNVVQAHIEEKFNVDIVNKQLWRRDREKYKLMFASGEAPDAGYMYVTPRDYFMQGVFRSISKDMIVEHVPSMAAWLDSLGPTAWLYGLVPGEQDEYMGLVRSYDYAMGVAYMPVFRLDWLEKVDLVPKNLIHAGAGMSEGKAYWTQTPPTFDEFESILYAFRDRDLDGNDRDDTVPYAMESTVAVRGGSRGLHMVFTLFGLNGVDNYDDGQGNPIKMAVHPNLQDALKTAQKWYNERLLDTELPTVSREQRDNKVINGQAGAYTSAPVYLASGGNPAAEAWLPNAIFKRDPAAKAVLTPVPLGPDGTHTSSAKSDGTLPIDDRAIMFMVSKDVSDEKLAKILKIVEYLNWDPEGRTYAYFGVPGVHFNWSGEEGNSPAVYTDAYERGGKSGILYYAYMNFYRELHLLYVNPQTKPLQAFFGAGGAGSQSSIPSYREDLFGESNYTDLWAQYGGALNTIKEEFIWQAITQNLNIDAEWDGYVNRWLNAGGQQVHAELTKMPIVQELQKGNRVY